MSRELWQIQEDFTKKFWQTKGGMPSGEPNLTIATKDYLLHLMKEVTEVLDQISFKMHRSPKDFVDRNNVLEEMIDCQKFLWGLMQVWGFSYDDFANEFHRKSIVVEQRFAQERAMQAYRDAPCVLVDIDGVLSDYPNCFIAWVAKTKNIYFEQADENIDVLPLDTYEQLKREYRQSGIKAHLPVLPGAREMLSRIREAGLKIILITNRPYAEHCRIYADTLQWLKENELPYDAIIWAKDKGFEAVKHFTKVCWAIDDTFANKMRFDKAGVQTVMVLPDTELDTMAFVRVMRTCADVTRVYTDWAYYVKEHNE